MSTSMTEQRAGLIAQAAEAPAGERVASQGALAEQRHQLTDPAVPPAGTLPAASTSARGR